ncbi:MAG: hypothetical protein ACK4WD_00170 [Flavobacteriales bacterium]|jgi:hypothetical protein
MGFIDFVSLLISCLAFIYSFRTYKRDNRKDNENQLYALKMDVYSRAIGEMAKLIVMVEDNLFYAKSAMNKNDDHRLNDLDDLADKLDDACDQFEVFFISNSLALPEEILDLLEEFSSKVQSIETLDSIHVSAIHGKEKISRMEDALSELVDLADKMSVIFRKDLKIVELNSSLYKRLSKNN